MQKADESRLWQSPQRSSLQTGAGMAFEHSRRILRMEVSLCGREPAPCLTWRSKYLDPQQSR
jgi:hypothetical protein